MATALPRTDESVASAAEPPEDFARCPCLPHDRAVPVLCAGGAPALTRSTSHGPCFAEGVDRVGPRSLLRDCCNRAPSAVNADSPLVPAEEQSVKRDRRGGAQRVTIVLWQQSPHQPPIAKGAP